MNMEDALELLMLNFNEKDGYIQKNNPRYVMSYEEYEAIDYLMDEWDYYYIGAAD